MIEIKDKEGNILLKTDKNVKDLIFTFKGKLQEITTFKLEGGMGDCNPTVHIYDSLLEILYRYWWGFE